MSPRAPPLVTCVGDAGRWPAPAPPVWAASGAAAALLDTLGTMRPQKGAVCTGNPCGMSIQQRAMSICSTCSMRQMTHAAAAGKPHGCMRSA